MPRTTTLLGFVSLTSLVLMACSGGASEDATASAASASTTAPSTCPASLFGAASPLNVYSLGDIDYACSDFEGAVGAAGSVRLNRVAVNAPFVRSERGWVGVAVPTESQFLAQRAAFDRLNGFTTTTDLREYAWVWDRDSAWNGETYGRYWDAAHAFVTGVALSAGGNVSLAELTVHAIPFEGGTVEAGGSVFAYSPPSPRHQVTASFSRAGVATTVPHARVSADLIHATDVIAGWGGTLTTLDANRELSFAGTAAMNVFRVTAADLRGASAIRITAPSTALVFVNVDDSGAVDLSDLRDGMALSGGVAADGVLWNFARALSLTLRNVVVEGTVLAPRARTQFLEGRVDGSLFVGNLDGSLSGSGEKAPVDALIACGSSHSGGQVNYWRFRGGI